MGYYSEVGLALTENGVKKLQERLGQMDADSSVKAEVLSLLEYADAHHADSESKAEVWHWKCIKWYTCEPTYFPDIDFIDNFLCQLDEDDYYLVRIGEDYDDTEVRGYFWENPFDLELARGITLACA